MAMPIGTSLEIGPDEGLELSKCVLCLRGSALYTEIWDDQPPLYTWLTVQLAKHLSCSILWPRLLSVFCAFILIGSFYLLVLNSSDLLSAGLATAMLIASPQVLELSCSCMQEVPALSFVLASLYVLRRSHSKSICSTLMAAALFGIALQIKFIAGLYAPIICFCYLSSRFHTTIVSIVRAICIFAGSSIIAFLLLNLMIGAPFADQFFESWSAHFAHGNSLEYGSAAQYTFDYKFIIFHLDAVFLAGLTFVCVLARILLLHRGAMLSIIWLNYVWLIFTFHRPWWPYYYVHMAIPVCWLGGIGFALVWNKARQASSRFICALVVCYGSVCLFAMGCRLYLQIHDNHCSRKTSSSLVLKTLSTYRGRTKYMFSDEPAFSFQAGIPLPPALAMLSLKRMWSGSMTNEKLISEFKIAKPDVVILSNTIFARLLQTAIARDYTLIVVEGNTHLYIRRELVREVAPPVDK